MAIKQPHRRDAQNGPCALTHRRDPPRGFSPPARILNRRRAGGRTDGRTRDRFLMRLGRGTRGRRRCWGSLPRRWDVPPLSSDTMHRAAITRLTALPPPSRLLRILYSSSSTCRFLRLSSMNLRGFSRGSLKTGFNDSVPPRGSGCRVPHAIRAPCGAPFLICKTKAPRSEANHLFGREKVWRYLAYILRKATEDRGGRAGRTWPTPAGFLSAPPRLRTGSIPAAYSSRGGGEQTPICHRSAPPLRRAETAKTGDVTVARS